VEHPSERVVKGRDEIGVEDPGRSIILKRSEQELNILRVLLVVGWSES
jgi:hypothetical protein